MFDLELHSLFSAGTRPIIASYNAQMATIIKKYYKK